VGEPGDQSGAREVVAAARVDDGGVDLCDAIDFIPSALINHR
jgi:hypothetical protein